MRRLMMTLVLCVVGGALAETAGPQLAGKPGMGQPAVSSPRPRTTGQATSMRKPSRVHSPRSGVSAKHPSDSRPMRQEAVAEDKLSPMERKLDLIAKLEDLGARGATEIARFLVDPEKEVAEAAFSAWTSILEDMDAHCRAEAICAAAQIIQRPPRQIVP